MMLAQSTDNVNNFDQNFTVSTPDVAAFEKYQLSDINKYVGKVNVKIPIYTIKSGNISFPIELSYDTGGIKVAQIASDVGLGWNISQCVITRNINHGNDFDSVGYNSKTGSGYTFNTNLESSNDIIVYNQNYGKLGYFLNKNLNYNITLQNRVVDFIPDQYNFYSPEFSTKYFFQDLSTPIEINPNGTKFLATKGKIQFDSKIRSQHAFSSTNVKCFDFPTQDFFSQTITSKNGIQYTFNDYDLSTNFEIYSPFGLIFSNSQDINYNPPIVSAWHVSQIKDITTNKMLVFEYDTTHSNPYADLGDTDTSINSIEQCKNDSQNTYSYCHNQGTSYNMTCRFQESLIGYYDVKVISKIDIQKKRLKRIVFDEGSVEYYYNNDNGSVSGIPNKRQDLYNGDFITKINIKNNKGEIIKTFNFNYDYFISNYGVGEFNPDNTNNTYRYKRLKLTSVQEVGKPAYQFNYEENIKLPVRCSFAFDFLGYNNNSADIATMNLITTTMPNPKLYYYPNNFEKSLLPFPVPNQNYGIINGYFNREANSNAKAWTLNNIIFPTGGFSQFNYESNTFQVFGQDIIGGGIRVSSQTLSEGTGSVRTINYNYSNDNGTSSGTLAAFPYFGHPLFQFFHSDVDSMHFYPPIIDVTATPILNVTNWKLFDRSNLNIDLTSGAYVGYSKVTEIESGHGKTEFYYSSNDNYIYQNHIYRYIPQECPSPIHTTLNLTSCLNQFIFTNSGFSADNFADNGIKRGQILDQKIYNESGTVIQDIVTNYNETLYNTYDFAQIITTPMTSQSPASNDLANFIAVLKKYEIKNFKKVQETKYDYLSNGTISTEKNYNYNSIGSIVNQNLIGTDNTITTNYYYPQDSQMVSEPNVSSLITNNVIGTPLKTETIVGQEKISEQKVVYAKDATTNNLLLPKYVWTKQGNDVNTSLEKQITFDLYDSKGNLLQFTQENGTTISIIWGYNQTLPIAKLINVPYSSISSTTINDLQTKSNTDTEANLITALNNLRITFSNAMINTYTYKPLFGPSTITDEKADVSYYNYDTNGRLLNIKDKYNRILSENEYHYKN